MACGTCGKKKKRPSNKHYSVMGGYKYLSDGQIKARLEVFKRLYCKDCEDRYKCDFAIYDACTKVKK